MKIRRTLATAVVAAVTTPAVLLSVTPAFAATTPDAQPQATRTATGKPSLAELEKAAEAANKAYEDALAKYAAAEKAFREAAADDAPHSVEDRIARKAAKDAEEAKKTADSALAAATNHLLTLDPEATAEEKAEAEEAVAEARTAAESAATAKAEADAKARAAAKKAGDIRVAAARDVEAARQAKEKALALKKAADKALADARAAQGGGDDEDDDRTCVAEKGLTSKVTGLPSKVVAGTTVAFTVRVTNGTAKNLDSVQPYVSLHAMDTAGLKDLDDKLRLQWSSTTSKTWRTVDAKHPIGMITGLRKGATADVKLRVTIDASTPKGEGDVLVASEYVNKDGSCGGAPFDDLYRFTIAPAGTTTGKVGDADKTTSTTRSGTSQTGAQGGRSTTTVTATTTSGSLAATGSDENLSRLALAGGAAVVLGAGAVLVARRRRGAGDDA
ncbi:peptidase [Streptomyces purpureus]|uniref:Gram-positive cocci surface proteins LPxTG domain-containing protein n=1 Tax=Streptomyces purpureus TaxID=1951 RepID=A0A918HDJ6_9ACTN|nr:peptidase [Streptomyces purpureus]GGT53994.1 hypothetical protein GCM10014713_54850 [Streptomyces purpureus]